ncbi:MAG: Gfo/Idh/MocA family protein [Phycisphaerae bacterium]
MADTLRWGILGAGRIARKFVQGARQADGCEPVAIGSRTQSKADAFGEETGLPLRFGSYEALVGCDEVDAVYVATPHPMHHRDALLAIGAGKHVLVEKAFTATAQGAREVIAAARKTGVFCMEAMWSRFLPPFTHLRKLIAEGNLGEVRQVHAHFGFRCEWDSSSRLLNPELGGGALLDVGIYPLSLASMVLGTPAEICSTGHIGQTGVDEQTAMLLGYASGAAAVLSCAVRTNTPKTVTVCGTEGMVHIENAWWGDRGLTFTPAGGEAQSMPLPREGNGFDCEIEHVAARIRDGHTESDVMPLDETLAILETADTIRGQIGLQYPFETIG